MRPSAIPQVVGSTRPGTPGGRQIASTSGRRIALPHSDTCAIWEWTRCNKSPNYNNTNHGHNNYRAPLGCDNNSQSTTTTTTTTVNQQKQQQQQE
eukprot:scaffold144232_cov18-Prasinocladus_malaysianus.AAC.1